MWFIPEQGNGDQEIQITILDIVGTSSCHGGTAVIMNNFANIL